MRPTVGSHFGKEMMGRFWTTAKRSCIGETMSIEEKAQCNTFLSGQGVLLDVRSPIEYEQGHIPGALNFPIFSNEERALIGTCYKRKSREKAVELGFEIVGPRIVHFIRQAKQLSPQINSPLRVYCWRGGMRSQSIAWCLQMAGFRPNILNGGYKCFRKWALSSIKETRDVVILGGLTGTGKTDILHELEKQGEQLIDLEKIANHRGSAFGGINMPTQPTQQQFDNIIATEWNKLDPSRPVWMEGESESIGKCRIPRDIMQQMDRALRIEITRPVKERIDFLVETYGNTFPDKFIDATIRLQKRLGMENTQKIIGLIKTSQLPEAAEILLTSYYDKTYLHKTAGRNSNTTQSIDVSGLHASEAAHKVCRLLRAHK